MKRLAYCLVLMAVLGFVFTACFWNDAETERTTTESSFSDADEKGTTAHTDETVAKATDEVTDETVAKATDEATDETADNGGFETDESGGIVLPPLPI